MLIRVFISISFGEKCVLPIIINKSRYIVFYDIIKEKYHFNEQDGEYNSI